jgi:hypothetical protein
MIQRKTFPVSDHCEIALTTEQMDDGWAVVASVKEIVGYAVRVTDLPVPVERFATEAEAEAFGVAAARDWIDRNAPRAA